MIKDIELFYPNIILTTSLNDLIKDLDFLKVTYITDKNAIFFNAIPFEDFFESTIIASFKDGIITKVLIKTSLASIPDYRKRATQTYYELLKSVLGTSDVNYQSADLSKDYYAWYDHDNLIIQTVYDHITFELVTLFILVKHKDINLKQTIKLSLTMSIFISLIFLIILSIIKNFTLETFLFSLLVFVLSSLIITLYIKLCLKYQNNFKNISPKIKDQLISFTKIPDSHKQVSYIGHTKFKKTSYKSILIFTKEILYLTYLKRKTIITIKLNYEDFINYSFYYKTLTINFSTLTYSFNLIDIKQTSSIIHDLKYHTKERSV